MLVIISSRMHDRVKDAWNGQIQRIDHEEDSNKVWQLSHLPMTNDVYMFAPSKIPRQILDQLLPLYVSLDDEEYMNVSGVKVKTDIKIRGFNSKKEVVDWYTIHDMLVERSDLRKASGDMVRQFCFGLDLPMNGSEIETVNMKNTHGFRNIIRGIRKPFWNIHALNGSKFINIEIDELGIDSLKDTEKKRTRSEEVGSIA